MKFKFGAEGPQGLNKDRVKFVQEGEETTETITENSPEIITQEAWSEEEQIPSKLSVIFSRRKDAWKSFKLATLGSLALTTGLNIGTEYDSRSENSATEVVGAENPKSLSESFAETNPEAFFENTREQVCKMLDADFMQRFTIIDETGEEGFNAGAFIVPFAVSVTESCTAKVDIEMHIPYHFARTFSEVAAVNPEARQIMVDKLAAYIQEQVDGQLVIRGVAGLTDTVLVWNKSGTVVQGIPRVDLGQIKMSDLIVTGLASAEAEASELHAGPESLTNSNTENIILASERRKELMPLLIPALQQAGIDVEVGGTLTELSFERNIIDADVERLARMSNEILGGTFPGVTSDYDLAFQLVKEYNENNPIVVAALEDNPEYAATMQELFDANRGVDVNLIASIENEKESVYPIAVIIPLLLLLLGTAKLQTLPGGVRTINHRGRVIERAVPDTVTREKVGVYSAKRRLFSETTPVTPGENRSFDAVYESISIEYQEQQKMLDHLLIEEILPSLNEETREPYIDYEKIVNDNREYLQSDSRKDGIEKSSYDTTPEAERKITEDLVEMWERHDAYLYPMDGVDVKTVLNYRHSEKVVNWAKLIAPLFVSLMKETSTTEEFRNLLEQTIEEAQAAGWRDRNTFVRSSI